MKTVKDAAKSLRVDHPPWWYAILTESKPGYGPALGLDGLARIVTQASGPVIALGGISAETAPLCLAGGAQGVAVMGEVMRAADPRAAVEAILRAISVS